MVLWYYIIIMAVWDKTYVDLFWIKSNSFKGEKDGLFFNVFPTSDEHQAKGTLYRCAVYDNQEDYEKNLAWERINSKFFFGIKERWEGENMRLSWMLFKEEEKKSYFVNMYDNKLKQPGKEHDKLLILKEAERREKA